MSPLLTQSLFSGITSPLGRPEPICLPAQPASLHCVVADSLSFCSRPPAPLCPTVLGISAPTLGVNDCPFYRISANAARAGASLMHRALHTRGCCCVLAVRVFSLPSCFPRLPSLLSFRFCLSVFLSFPLPPSIRSFFLPFSPSVFCHAARGS